MMKVYQHDRQSCFTMEERKTIGRGVVNSVKIT